MKQVGNGYAFLRPLHWASDRYAHLRLRLRTVRSRGSHAALARRPPAPAASAPTQHIRAALPPACLLPLCWRSALVLADGNATGTSVLRTSKDKAVRSPLPWAEETRPAARAIFDILPPHAANSSAASSSLDLGGGGGVATASVDGRCARPRRSPAPAR